MSSKKNMVVALLSVGAFFCGAAFADLDPKFYVGAEAQANHYNSAKTLKGTDTKGKRDLFFRTNGKSFLQKSGGGLSGFVGTRLNEFFGVEAGYTYLGGAKFRKFKNYANSSKYPKARHHNLHADLMAFAPVSDCVEMIGAVGVGQLNSKISGNYVERTPRNVLVHDANLSQKSRKAGLRLGAGVGYKFDENLTGRLMVRHQKGNKILKDVSSVGFGLSYQF